MVKVDYTPWRAHVEGSAYYEFLALCCTRGLMKARYLVAV